MAAAYLKAEDEEPKASLLQDGVPDLVPFSQTRWNIYEEI